MTPDAPSPLHRALRWSIPGAALLSIPVGAWLQPKVAALLGLTFPIPWKLLILPIGFLYVATPFTSCIALKHIIHERAGAYTGLVAIFNVIVLCITVGIPLFFLLGPGIFPNH